MRLPLGGTLSQIEREIIERADALNAKRNVEAYFEAVYVRNADGSFRQLDRAEFVADATTGSAAEINAIRDALVTAGLMKPS